MHKGLQSLFLFLFFPTFSFSLFQIPPPSFPSLVISLSLSPLPSLFLPHTASLPQDPFIIPPFFLLLVPLFSFCRTRSVAGTLARGDLSLSLKECERDSRRKRRDRARGREAMEESKKNAPVEQLLHDSHECSRYVCVYERAGA